MTPAEQARWRSVREIFEEASEAESGDRAGLVANRCGGDAALRGEMEELLALRKETGLALDRPPVASTQQQNLAAQVAHAAADSHRAVPRYNDGAVIGGRYRIVKFLARGGMGEVYEAFDESESRSVALKFVRQIPTGQEQLEARFLREVRMARKIEHPNVCHIFDLAEHEGERFCVMELLRGETLTALLAREGKIPPDKALRIAGQLCDGLQAAHQAGVLHRDLKPGNVFLVDRRAVIIDFGLAAAAVRDSTGMDSSLTATGAVIGTFAYMAPEQLEEGGGVEAADLYSLGVVFYEMLTGVKPHDAKSPFRLAAQKARESHRNPSGSGISAMPAVWREVITRLLKVRPLDRYSSALRVKRALKTGRPSVRFVLAKPWVFVPSLALLACLLAVAGMQWKRRDHIPLPQAAQLYEKAFEAMTTSSPMRAVKLLEQAIELDENFVNARSLLAVAHAETDQIDKAKDALLQAIAAKDKRWVLGRGESLALDAASAAVRLDFTAAAERYRQLSTLPGNRVFALLSRARMLEQAGKRDEAILTLESAIGAGLEASSSPAARVRLASLLCRKQDYEKAASEFAKAEAAYQKTDNVEGLCDLWIARALNLRKQSKAEDRADLDRAIALSAKAGNRYQNLSARLRMVNLAESEFDYGRAIAVAGEVAAEAQRAGMLEMAARATAELGYAYAYSKKPEEAAAILRQSVELAQRAKSHGVLASNCLKLGEMLAALASKEEAVTVMEPAVQWYRQSGADNVLPLILIKWGTALGGSSRFEEAVALYREAADLGAKNGEELYQGMALHRLMGYYYWRDVKKAAEDWEQAVVLARKTHQIRVYFDAANLWSQVGEFERARQLIAEGEEWIVELLEEGPDEAFHSGLAHFARANVYLRQGRCGEAVALLSKAERGVADYAASGRLLRRSRACWVSNPSSLRSDLGWFEGQIAEMAAKSLDNGIAELTIHAGDLALRLKDWPAAKRHALRGVEASRIKRLRVHEMENTMVLRAAEARMGNRSEAERLTAEVLKLARDVGFEKPSEFAGRQDLLFFWKLGGNVAQHK